MKLSRAMERLGLRARNGPLQKLASDLLQEVREGSASKLQSTLTRVAAALGGEHKASASPNGRTVFNIAIAVAVGVPVSKGEPEDGHSDPARDGDESDSPAMQAAGAPAVATASVTPESLSSVPRAALAANRSKDSSAAAEEGNPKSRKIRKN